MTICTYRTEDGVELHTGDVAYDYYSMKPGRIGRAISGQEGWFDFEHDDGTVTMLNGQRICSMAYAVKRGFKGAAIAQSSVRHFATSMGGDFDPDLPPSGGGALY